jgi:hypothetical protein
VAMTGRTTGGRKRRWGVCGLVGIEGQGTSGEESYRLLMRCEGFRVGVLRERREEGPDVMSVELLVRLFRTGTRLGPDDMELALGLVKSLTGMGYSICFQGDGWVSCERPVGDADIEAEARLLRDLLEGR